MPTVRKRELLEDLRLRNRYTQMRLATFLGISQSSYSNIEMGYVDPAPEVKTKLIDLFNLDPDYFDDKADLESEGSEAECQPVSCS